MSFFHSTKLTCLADIWYFTSVAFAAPSGPQLDETWCIIDKQLVSSVVGRLPHAASAFKRQYLYFSTSKASKAASCRASEAQQNLGIVDLKHKLLHRGDPFRTFVPVKQVMHLFFAPGKQASHLVSSTAASALSISNTNCCSEGPHFGRDVFFFTLVSLLRRSDFGVTLEASASVLVLLYQ